MAWIESHDNLAGHPKTRRAARILGLSIPTMMGHLHLLWHWCLKYADDGDLSGYDHADIADAMMWDGDPTQLIDALLSCGPGDKAGFLEYDSSGSLIVHDWFDYAGALIEKREEARKAGAKGNHERWHVQRGIVDPDCPFCAESEGVSKPDSGGDKRTQSGGESGSDSGSDRVLSHRTLPYPTIPIKDDEEDTRTPAREDDLSQDSGDPEWTSLFAQVYKSNINEMVRQEMEEACGEFGVELVKEAMRRSLANAEGPPRQYLRGLLSGWREAGIFTLADLAAEDERRKMLKNGTRGRPRSALKAAPDDTPLHRRLRERGQIV